MNLIIETDIGRDPDDLFAIAYLVAAGVQVRAVLISPGDRDQVAICRLLLERSGVSCPIGVAKPDRTGRSSGGVHSSLLRRHNRPSEADADGEGVSVMKSALTAHPDSELFVIGPVSSIGRYCRENSIARFARATMQGGFLGYHQHDFACPRLEKFEGADWQDTFNLNGDRKGGEAFLAASIADRRMVGKNVCHTVLFDAAKQARLKPQSAAAEFFVEAADILLGKTEEKKFHDPTAAACHLHPEIGSWARGRTVRKNRGWGTDLDPVGDHILGAVDYDALWDCLCNFR
jgi:pyrimidine-specific ribonucleoside hydrolase